MLGPPRMDSGLHRASDPRSEHPAFCPGLGGLAGEWGPPQIPVPLEPWNTTFFGIRTFQDGVRGLEMKGLPGTLPSRRSSELSRGPETWAPGGRGHWACGVAWTGEWSLGGWPTRGQCPPPAQDKGVADRRSACERHQCGVSAQGKLEPPRVPGHPERLSLARADPRARHWLVTW